MLQVQQAITLRTQKTAASVFMPTTRKIMRIRCTYGGARKELWIVIRRDGGAEFNYNSLNAGLAASHCTVTSVCWGSVFAEYSFYCHSSNNVLGSVGLRKKN